MWNCWFIRIWMLPGVSMPHTQVQGKAHMQIHTEICPRAKGIILGPCLGCWTCTVGFWLSLRSLLLFLWGWADGAHPGGRAGPSLLSQEQPSHWVGLVVFSWFCSRVQARCRRVVKQSSAGRVVAALSRDKDGKLDPLQALTSPTSWDVCTLCTLCLLMPSPKHSYFSHWEAFVPAWCWAGKGN